MKKKIQINRIIDLLSREQWQKRIINNPNYDQKFRSLFDIVARVFQLHACLFTQKIINESGGKNEKYANMFLQKLKPKFFFAGIKTKQK